MVQSIGGLSDLHPGGLRAPRTRLPALGASASIRPRVVTGGPQPCAAATVKAASQTFPSASPRTTYTADQIAAAYDFPGLYQAGDFGAGQTVALVEQSTYAPADVAAFQSCYGTNASVSAMAVGGGVPAANAGSLEVPLDIDQIIGIAPQARILVYVGPGLNAQRQQQGAALPLSLVARQADDHPHQGSHGGEAGPVQTGAPRERDLYYRSAVGLRPTVEVHPSLPVLTP